MKDPLIFLAGESEMAALMRAHDWSQTPLGPPQNWPQSLRTVTRLMLNTRHPMFVFWGPTLACLYNDAYSASIGPERHPVALGRPGRDVWEEIWDVIGPQIELVMAGKGATWHENQLIPITRHGRRDDVYWTYSYSPIDDETSTTGIGGVLVVCTETTQQIITEQVLAERAAVRTAERDRLTQLFEQAPSFMALLSGPDHRIELANEAYLRLIGRRDVLGKTVGEALPDAVAQGYLGLLDEVFRSGKAFTSVGAKYAVQTEPGGHIDERFLDFIYQPVRNEYGKVIGIFTEGSDVTDRTLAENALRDLTATLEQRIAVEAAARNKTEEALRQAQKMEAIGQLTGGIAHDFNNMLQAITGGINLAERRISGHRLAEASEYLRGAMTAATRAAALTRRLLAFGRRQPLDPKPVKLDDLVGGLVDMIQRTVGPAISLELRLQENCWPVRCDPNQLENALLNLAINARDAMPNGGRLIIETTNVVLDETETATWEGSLPGEYVRVTVIDDGMGMTPDVLTHAFEPFFTTKLDGEGTGLGLSQVYGFMRQSQGVVRLESEINLGTSVHLYLPRHGEDHGRVEKNAATETAQMLPRSASEVTVLLVEDEAAIREYAAQSLRELGYQVLEAEDGGAGLATLRKALRGPEDGQVTLLITDIGLPGGLNGRQLADAARELVPGLPILLITGYAGDAMKRQDQLLPGMEILVKPFRLEVLAARVQMMTDKRGSIP